MVPEATPEPVKFCDTLRANWMEAAGSQLMGVNKNRCLRLAAVELYIGNLLRSTKVEVAWDHEELMVVSMDIELVSKYDLPFPEGGTYLSLRHARTKFQNMSEEG